MWADTTIACSVTAQYAGDRSPTQTSQLANLVGSFINKRTPKLYIMKIPPFALPVGKYSFSCRIRMPSVSNGSATVSNSISIVRSPIDITLLPLGKSKITLGYKQQYTLSPKLSLIDTNRQVEQS